MTTGCDVCTSAVSSGEFIHSKKKGPFPFSSEADAHMYLRFSVVGLNSCYLTDD